MNAQASILAGVPAHAVFLFLDVRSEASPREALQELVDVPLGGRVLVGLGSTLLRRLEARVPGMRPMPDLAEATVPVPRTPHDLLVRISGADPGEVLHRERALLDGLTHWQVGDRTLAFQYGESRDLTGYEDGTENPTGDEAAEAALVRGAGPGLEGSSVVAVQRWVHDLDHFQRMSKSTQDATFGRERISNEEMDDAPASAHVKRTAQEDFDPEAFVVRRSMPWREGDTAGLVFVAFGASLDPFEALLRRMCGLDDGIVDALFSFTRPVTGATFWCPPAREGRLDLTVLTP